MKYEQTFKSKPLYNRLETHSIVECMGRHLTSPDIEPKQQQQQLFELCCILIVYVYHTRMCLFSCFPISSSSCQLVSFVITDTCQI